MSAPVLMSMVLAVGCLAYVLYPIVGPALRGAAPPKRAAVPDGAPLRDVTDEEIEAAIRFYRVTHAPGASPAVCPVCGPRPEPDALYCSSCGRALAG